MTGSSRRPAPAVTPETEFLRPSDVKVAELYDGFTINCLSWIEALGFCGIGEAKDFLDGGKNIARDGILPLNTHGGQHGRPHAGRRAAAAGGHVSADPAPTTGDAPPSCPRHDSAPLAGG